MKVKNIRGRRKHFKPSCPICKEEMQRKGRKGPNEFFKCKKCRGRLNSSGIFIQPPNPDSIDIYNHQLKAIRREFGKRVMIVKMKKEKYSGIQDFLFEGEVINLGEYDKDGVSFAEKKKFEEAQKKRELERKKQEKKKKGKEVK